MGFVMEVIELLLRNLLLLQPRSPVLLCQFADLLYAREHYKEAAQTYTTIIYMYEQELCNLSNVDKIFDDTVRT
jgi:hypothetical protein